jgi:NADH dehydrogenase
MSIEAIPKRVVIIGGGFAGLFAARAFRNRPVEVTLVDRAGHHLFQPLLYQCATGILSEGEIATPLRHLLKRLPNVELVLAEVVDFDVSGRRVIAERPGGSQVDLPYDYLIAAAGVRQSYFGHDEFAEHAPGMKSITDALIIRRKVFGAFEMAESSTDPDERRRWLTFVCVGAGPTGVELAGQIRELATRTIQREYRHISPDHARVLLFDGGEVPLASFGDKLSRKAAKALDRMGVEFHQHSLVSEVDDRGVEVRSGGKVDRYEAGTVLWTAGVRAPEVAERLAKATGAEQDRAGRIKVLADCTIPGHPEVSVVGDMMSLNGLSGVAEVAMQTGLYTAHRIRRLAEEGDVAVGPFKYRDLGSAAYLARHQAVISFKGMKLSGFLGWVSWLFIHIAFLTGFRNRLGAVMTWFLAFNRGSRKERAFTIKDLATAKETYSVERGRSRAAPAGASTSGDDPGAPRE